MLKKLWISCVQTMQKLAGKCVCFCTNPHTNDFFEPLVTCFTQKTTQVFYSLLHVIYAKAHLLCAVVHIFPIAYNNNYINKENGVYV